MSVNFTYILSFEMLNDNLRLIREKHAPLHSCRVINPWYNAMEYDIAAKNIGIGQKDSTYKIQLF